MYSADFVNQTVKGRRRKPRKRKWTIIKTQCMLGYILKCLSSNRSTSRIQWWIRSRYIMVVRYPSANISSMYIPYHLEILGKRPHTEGMSAISLVDVTLGE